MPHNRRRREFEDRDRQWRESSRPYREADEWSTYGRPMDYDDDRDDDSGQPYDRDYEQGRFGGQRGRGRTFENREFGPERGYGRGRSGGFNRSERDFSDRGYGYGSDREFDQTGSEDWEDEYEDPYTWTYTEFWLIPGPYTGIGPQGYQRSDDRIFEDVCERLSQHGQLDAHNIEVEVENGEVTLKGSVTDRRSKRMAEDAVDTISGVWDVHNRLRIEGSEQRQLYGRASNQGSAMQSGAQPHSRSQQTGGSQPATGSQSGTMQGGNIRTDMKVVGRDGEEIGVIKRVRQNDFLVDRTLERDVFIPFQAGRVEGDRVKLNIRASEVDAQDWPTPDLIDTPGQDSEKNR